MVRFVLLCGEIAASGPALGDAEAEQVIMWLPEVRPSNSMFAPIRTRWTGLLVLMVGFLGACDLDYPTTTWNDPAYDHVALSGGFELVGPHDGAACVGCHEAGNMALKFEPSSNQDCATCHSADFQARHGGSQYPTTCLSCHGGQAWERGPFDHETDSGGFDLWGPHANLECSSCHLVPGTFAPRFDPSSDQDCAACHG